MTSWLDREIQRAKKKPVVDVSPKTPPLAELPMKRPVGRPKGGPKRIRPQALPPLTELPPRRRRPTGEEIIDWIQRKCYVPEGKLLGQKFVLDDWQKAETLPDLRQPLRTRRAILSFGAQKRQDRARGAATARPFDRAQWRGRTVSFSPRRNRAIRHR